MTSNEAPWLTAYAPALDRGYRALAVAAAIAAIVELAVGPHREISAVFLAVGLLVGAVVGRYLSRELRIWADDAPVTTAVERGRVLPSRPSLVAVTFVVVITLVAVVVPIVNHIPTPLPGACAAGAIQTFLQRRMLHAVEQRRRGQIVRPTGRMSFDGSELRLLSLDPATGDRMASG